MEQRKVLLVSRNPLIANSIEFLKKHAVSLVASSELALEALEKERIDAVVVFDDIEGETIPSRAVEKIKKHNNTLPVIFLALTAQSMERAKCCGADRAYLLQHAMYLKKDVVCELCSYYEALSLGLKPDASSPQKRASQN